jgi:hypothetical protein
MNDIANLDGFNFSVSRDGINGIKVIHIFGLGMAITGIIDNLKKRDSFYGPIYSGDSTPPTFLRKWTIRFSKKKKSSSFY